MRVKQNRKLGFAIKIRKLVLTLAFPLSTHTHTHHSIKLILTLYTPFTFWLKTSRNSFSVHPPPLSLHMIALLYHAKIQEHSFQKQLSNFSLYVFCLPLFFVQLLFTSSLTLCPHPDNIYPLYPPLYLFNPRKQPSSTCFNLAFNALGTHRVKPFLVKFWYFSRF